MLSLLRQMLQCALLQVITTNASPLRVIGPVVGYSSSRPASTLYSCMSHAHPHAEYYAPSIRAHTCSPPARHHSPSFGTHLCPWPGRQLLRGCGMNM
ncbi:hypothetical protein B0I35DRAFT_10604 [Stachybotrys elegans]|uniref:Secreted protein n=1 Tax=Stachybotrys elegans TaxID=80388 RepID=A0A8K0T1I5_9HYPO|nr:hypothetical protein B0I35DRAFT_10604 [Stachybotrys elegans]